MDMRIVALVWMSGLLVSLWGQVIKGVPGGVAELSLPGTDGSLEARSMGHRGAVVRKGGRIVLLVPVALETKPGRYPLVLERDGSKRRYDLLVVPKRYDEQHLVIRRKRMVEPSSADRKRIRSEAPRKRRAKAYRTAKVPDADLIWPVDGAISSTFGLRRYFNGKPRSPHRGIDIAASAGTPVRAASDGVVVDAGDFFFSGNLVFIEHGQGLMTLYAHLEKFVVEAGERVKKGQRIGYVGSSGRATGPHLHFSTLIDGVYVDPALFLPDAGQAKSKE